MSLVVHGLIGWGICGATVGLGRQVVSTDVTLWIHGVVAPLAFGLLARRFFRRFPKSSAAGAAVTMVGIVVGLDALVVAPFLERSYAMFGSPIGTWIPFASIFAASYVVGRAFGSKNRMDGENSKHTV